MNNRITKGIVLAGGSGSRLYPATSVSCKQLLAVYDKPMIYYPISTLMLCGIRDFLLISTPTDLPSFQKLLGGGSRFGIRIQYAPQPEPKGIAQSILIGESFIGDSAFALILGDNLFYGTFDPYRKAALSHTGATIFGYFVTDPQRYGVVESDIDNIVISIEEKPHQPKSNYAVTGLYFYNSDAIKIARGLKPSARGELEITDVNAEYLRRGTLRLIKLGRGIAWLDTGTHEALLDAGNFIATVEKRQGLKIGSIEEISLRMSYVPLERAGDLVKEMPLTPYRSYIEGVISELSGRGR